MKTHEKKERGNARIYCEGKAKKATTCKEEERERKRARERERERGNGEGNAKERRRELRQRHAAATSRTYRSRARRTVFKVWRSLTERQSKQCAEDRFSDLRGYAVRRFSAHSDRWGPATDRTVEAIV